MGKIIQYREMVRTDITSFNPSVTTLANEAINSYFKDVIGLQKKIRKSLDRMKKK